MKGFISPQKKEKVPMVKAPPFTQEFSTIDHWKQFIVDLDLFDTKYECKYNAKSQLKEKNFIKEYNITSYFLETFDMMGQLKDQAFTGDSFIICLIELNVIRQRNTSNPDHLKIFLSQFVSSFNCIVVLSSELSYFTHILSPTILPQQYPQFFAFFVKLRKYIVQHFINDRDANHRPLNFEQWVSIVAKFLDNKAIVTVGNKIKEKLCLSNKNEKIMDNRQYIQKQTIYTYKSVDYFDLMKFCCEDYQERLKQKMPPPGEKGLQKNQTSEHSASVCDDQSLEQQDASLDKQGKAHRIAYNIAMGPDQAKKSNQNNEQSPPHDQNKNQLSQAYAKQDQMKLQINQQAQMISTVVEIHENLASRYKYLQHFNEDMCELVRGLIVKIKDGYHLSEEELKNLEDKSGFNEYLKEDPEQVLRQSGVYEYIQKN